MASEFSILIPIHKPIGMTSFDVIRAFKKKYKLTRHVKIGHFGTLDPFAEGLLLVGIGKCLRLMPYVHKLCSKSYWAVGALGVKTLSGDHTGERVQDRELAIDKAWALEVANQGQEFLNLQAKALVGQYMQSRPYFSAAKVDGIPLYEYARRGEFIEVEKVERSIYQFEICDKKNIYPGEVALAPETLKLTPLLLFHTEVGTGTYVRTLFEDFCSKLGGVGHLVALYRDKIGPIGLARALRMQELEHCQELSDLEKYGINPLELLPLPQIWPDQESIKKLKCGQRLSLDLWKTEMTGPYAWAMVNTEYGPSIVGMLESDGAKIRLALHWTAP